MTNYRGIFVSAGHAPWDPGAVSQGETEHAITTKASMYLLGELERKFQWSVTAVPTGHLNSKTAFVNEVIRNLDHDPTQYLAVEVHCNSFETSQPNGYETLYHKLSTRGERAAKMIQEHLEVSIRGEDPDIYKFPLGLRSIQPRDNLAWLTQLPCTALILELGFMSNPEDLRVLLDDRQLHNMMLILANALTVSL